MNKILTNKKIEANDWIKKYFNPNILNWFHSPKKIAKGIKNNILISIILQVSNWLSKDTPKITTKANL